MNELQNYLKKRKQNEILTNAELMDFYLCEKKHLSKATRNEYRRIVTRFERFLSGKNLQEATEFDSRAYIETLKNRSLSFRETTIKTLRVFYNFFIYARDKIEAELRKSVTINKNPFNFIYNSSKLERMAPKRYDAVLEREEIPIYLKTIKELLNYKHYLMIKLVLASSCRIGGICNLEIKNIDFDVRQFKTIDKGCWRIYCFSKTLIPELLMYMKIRRQLDAGNDYLFLTKNKRKYSSSSLLASYGKILPKIEKRLRKTILPTNLRKSFRTIRILSGQQSLIIELLMGRRSKNLEHVYTRLRGKNLTREYDKHDFLI
ncbi:MAG: tyrosine-type recombinase/integrase [Candidatus Helarchaeota archaeon]